MKYKVGDHVKIISKHGGVYDLDDIKRFSDCPNLDNSIIKSIDGSSVIIDKYAFFESDLLPVCSDYDFYSRLLTKRI